MLKYSVLNILLVTDIFICFTSSCTFKLTCTYSHENDVISQSQRFTFNCAPGSCGINTKVTFQTEQDLEHIVQRVPCLVPCAAKDRHPSAYVQDMMDYWLQYYDMVALSMQPYHNKEYLSG